MKKNLSKLLVSCLTFFLLYIGISTIAFASNLNLTYQGHLADIGWANLQSNNEICGTTGENRRIEAIIINLKDNNSSAIEYSTHVEDYGWLNYVSSGNISGTTGEAKRVEAIKIRLTSSAKNNYDLYYRSHVQDYGWLDWVKNDEIAGTTGQAKKMEAIQIKLVPKGSESIENLNSVSPSSSGSLRVSGNKLVDSSGKAVQLKGISTHGINWFPGYVNQNMFTELKNTWNSNVVRLAMYTSEYNGYCAGGNKEELKQLVRNGINYATKANLYVIVDWHILSDSNPNQYVAEAKDFFNTISSEYKNSNNIIYEICNEPNGSTSWNDIKTYAEQVIPVIRSNDSDALILVGTPTWSQDIHLISQNPLNYSNVMYTFHFYAGTHKDDLRNRVVSTVNAGLPVFVSEFGISDASGNGNLDIASGNQWISTLDSLGISYVCWNLSNKDESSSLIKSSVTKTYGLSQNDLSEQGKWYTNILSGNLPTISTPSTPSNPPSSSDITGTSGKVEYTLSMTNSWQSNNAYYYQYNIIVKNNTNTAISNWSIDLKANTSFNIESSWNGNYSINGNTLKITNVDYNGTLNSGSSANDVGFIIRSNSPLELK